MVMIDSRNDSDRSEVSAKNGVAYQCGLRKLGSSPADGQKKGANGLRARSLPR